MNDHSSKDFIEQSIGWIKQLAKQLLVKFDLPGSELDELVAAGSLGLVEASERFEPEKGVPFRNYAHLRVRGSMIDAIRRNSDLSARGRRYAKALDAANDLGYSQEDQKKPEDARQALARTLARLADGAIAFRMSLDDSERSQELVDTTPNPEELFLKSENLGKLRESLLTLDETEQIILSDYYFHDKSFVTIARELDITKGWVSKIHQKALQKLQTHLSQLKSE